MRTLPEQAEYRVTEEKIAETVRRIVDVAHPLKIIAFGSRVRGNATSDSDLDLAVILDKAPEPGVNPLPRKLLSGLGFPLDLIVIDKDRHDVLSKSANSVHRHIEQEGLVLYSRDERSPDRSLITKISR